MRGLLRPLILVVGCASQANSYTMTVLSAHYNLALTLDRHGRKADAKRHDTEAANVAQDNKIMWDSPLLCTQSNGFNDDIYKASYQDATSRSF